MNLCVAILILKIEKNKQHFWHIMLYYFKKSKNATETHTQKDLCSVQRRCCDWSNMSKVVCEVLCWRFSPDNAPGSGRQVEVDSNQIKTLIENNQHYTMQDIADLFKILKSIIGNHFHQLSYVNRFDVWVPQKLSEKTFLTVFMHAILYWNVTKMFNF